MIILSDVRNINSPDYDEQRYIKAYNNMTPERCKKTARYKNNDDRRRCVFADELLRKLLGELGYTEKISFYTDEKGKPHLVGDQWHYSLSHSGNYVACTVSDSPVGMDIEEARDVNLNVIKRVCTEEELGFVLGNAAKPIIDKDVSLRFLQVWTAKEAYLKFTGEGLSGGLQSISVATEDGIKTELDTGQILESEIKEHYVIAIVRSQE